MHRFPGSRAGPLSLALVAFCLGVSGCGDSGGRSEAAGLQDAVTGEVTYREFMALPDKAVVTVRVSQETADPWTGEPLGEHRITEPDGPPTAFSVPYDESDVEEDVGYVLVAEIREGRSVLFSTDEPVPVITKGNPTEDVDIVLVRAGSTAVTE